MDSPHLLCPLLAFGTLVAILVTVATVTRRRESRREGWQAFAARLGLEYDPKAKRITGVIDGLGVQVYVGLGLGQGPRAQGEHTVAEVSVPELPRGFCMKSEHNALHMLGAAMAPVAGIDPTLQRLYLIRDWQKSPAVVAALQQRELIDVLVKATREHTVSIEEGRVRVIVFGVVLSMKRLDKMLQQALAAGRALSKALAVSP